MKSFLERKKGFTIIELVVVIAIIAILSSIIITKVSSFRNKAKDAVIKQDMTNFFQLATDYWQAHGDGNFGGFCNDQATRSLFDAMPALDDNKEMQCFSNSFSWVICAQMNFPEDRTEAWCIDETGIAKIISASSCDNNIHSCQ